MISHAWAALLMGFAAQAAVAQERAALPYDAEKDFAPVNLTVAAPLVLVVHPSTPAKSVNDLVKLAKARPGQLAFPLRPREPPVILRWNIPGDDAKRWRIHHLEPASGYVGALAVDNVTRVCRFWSRAG